MEFIPKYFILTYVIGKGIAFFNFIFRMFITDI